MSQAHLLNRNRVLAIQFKLPVTIKRNEYTHEDISSRFQREFRIFSRGSTNSFDRNATLLKSPGSMVYDFDKSTRFEGIWISPIGITTASFAVISLDYAVKCQECCSILQRSFFFLISFLTTHLLVTISIFWKVSKGSRLLDISIILLLFL